MNAMKLSAVLLATACFLPITVSCSRTQTSYPSLRQQGAYVVVDTADLADGVPQFHTYRYREKNINFFVIKTGNAVHSYLDACANCSVHKKGYRSEGGSVICRHCGTTLPADKLEKGLGSCCPIKVEGGMKGGTYRIPVPALERAADKF